MRLLVLPAPWRPQGQSVLSRRWDLRRQWALPARWHRLVQSVQWVPWGLRRRLVLQVRLAL